MEIDVRLLKAKLKYNGRTYAEIAEALGMTRDTFAKRIQRQDFSIKHVHGLMKAVPLTMEEVLEIFFAEGEKCDNDGIMERLQRDGGERDRAQKGNRRRGSGKP